MELGKAHTETVVIHQVERELLLPAEPDEAWEAIADPERLGEWLGGEVEMDPTPGGDFRIAFDDGGERVGWVEEVEPGERLSFWWRRPDRRGRGHARGDIADRDRGRHPRPRAVADQPARDA